MMGKRYNRQQRGMTFIELVIALAVFSVVSMAAYPVADASIRRSREVELRQHLRTIRQAIDAYYAAHRGTAQHGTAQHGTAQHGTAQRRDEGDYYPKNLAALVAGRYLRTIPIDPMTGRQDWVVISTSDSFDDDDSEFNSDGCNVFDVRSRALGAPPRGLPYRKW